MKTEYYFYIVIIAFLLTAFSFVFADRMDSYCQTRTGFELFVCDTLNVQDERITALEKQFAELNNTSIITPISVNSTVTEVFNIEPIKLCDTKIVNGVCVDKFELKTRIFQGDIILQIRGTINEPSDVTVMIKNYSNDLVYIDQVKTDKQFKFSVNTSQWEGTYFIKISSNGESITDTVYYGSR